MTGVLGVKFFSLTPDFSPVWSVSDPGKPFKRLIRLIVEDHLAKARC
jgi:hypothetical protein